MIKVTFTLLMLIPVWIIGMDTPLSSRAESDHKKPLTYTILPRDVCSFIAHFKGGTDLENRESKTHFINDTPEKLRMSLTWNTATLIPESQLMEHQLWVGHRKLRFDNDITQDCNEFQLEESINLKEEFFFDGPNNDTGSEGTIEGRAGGIILVARSIDPQRERDEKKTEFYLFKQHNISVSCYNKTNLDGIQQRIPTNRGERSAFNYYNFPYVSAPLLEHSLDFCALAPHGRGLVATTDSSGVHHLHVFNFNHVPNYTDPAKPDQSFKVAMLAHATLVPLFTRLAWIYGRTLLGITNQNELYVVAIKEEADKPASIQCFKQKTEKKFTNFCVRRPHDHHQLFLCDTQKKLYTANLKRRTPSGALIFKPATEKKVVKEGEIVREIEEVPALPYADRLWAYNNTLMAMQIKDAQCTLFKITAKNTPEFINEKLHELKSEYDRKKAAGGQLIDNQMIEVFEEYALELQKK